ncbi:MAG: DNA-binding response regulator [Bdellovibrio sp. CG10_big_fil_rev_8_21_14_0_10_47_8]|nr:MAG: DNA-binding response regulator [Bdellovibrio sp. CG10_big_fil_rev_8_21_14_0_10_47_8]
MVEDESEIRELISLLLLRQGHRVQQCSTAMEALDSLKKNHYDLMVLDWMLPHMSGLDLLRNLSQGDAEKVPVLMVTAKAEPDDIVRGLEMGADDYITKPFEPSIFSARVKALLRRAQSQGKSSEHGDVIQLGDLTINLASYEIRMKGELVHLTPSEFKIMATLAQHRGRVLTRDQLIEIVQGEGISVTGRTIDTHVFGLRKKLEQSADWIETIRGVGYRVKPG